MQRIRKLPILGLLLSMCPGAMSAAIGQTAVADVDQKTTTIKWLGNAGWEIQFGQTVILIDPSAAAPEHRRREGRYRFVVSDGARRLDRVHYRSAAKERLHPSLR